MTKESRSEREKDRKKERKKRGGEEWRGWRRELVKCPFKLMELKSTQSLHEIPTDRQLFNTME